MKLKERISWLMGNVQKSLFPHLDECLDVPLTDQEKHLVSILEIVQVEKYVPKSGFNQWLGRKLEEREASTRGTVPFICSKVAVPGAIKAETNMDFPANTTVPFCLWACHLN